MLRRFLSSASSRICMSELFSLSSKARSEFQMQGQPEASSFNPKVFLENSRFLAHEISKRLSDRVNRFQTLPFIVGTHPNIQELSKLYQDSLSKVKGFVGREMGIAEAKEFSEKLGTLLQNHSQVLDLLSVAVRDCQSANYMNRKDLIAFVEEMVKARIALRILAEHHLALLQKPHFGIVHPAVSPSKLLKGSVIPFCRDLCARQFGESQVRDCEIVVDGCLSCSFSYIPAHLDYILFELLKNALVASINHNRLAMKRGGLSGLPSDKIIITIARGDGSVTIRIRDKAGGIPLDLLDRVFDYNYSTSNSTSDIANDGFGSFIGQMDVNMQTGGAASGFGFGLPVSRLYAMYFGGNIELVSMEGYGCDVFVRLRDLTEFSQSIE